MWDNRRKCADGAPIIDIGLIHHSAGDEGKDWWDSAIIDALNRTGFSRGYAPYGYDFKTGYSKCINDRTGKEFGQNPRKLPSGEVGYCEYHAAVHAYDLDKASPYYGGGFRVVWLLDDPLMVDPGSTWDTEINSRSFAICFLGDYEKNDLPKGMIDWFISQWAPATPTSKAGEFHKVLQVNPKIQFKGHKDIDRAGTPQATKCPGVNLYSYIPRIGREIEIIGGKIE